MQLCGVYSFVKLICPVEYNSCLYNKCHHEKCYYDMAKDAINNAITAHDAINYFVT